MDAALKAALAVAVLAGVAGTWFVTSGDGSDAEAADVVAPEATLRADEDLTPYVARGVDGMLELMTSTVGVLPPAPRVAAAVAEPAPDDARLAADVNALAQRLSVGVASADDVLALCDALLADVETLEPERHGDALRYRLRDGDELRATLVVRPDAHPDCHDAVLDIDAAATPGELTGLVDDGADRTRVEIAVSTPREGREPYVSTLASACWKPSAALRSQLSERPVPIGGFLSIRAGDADWRPLTIAASERDGEVGVLSATGEPEPVPGDARAPRFERLFARFAAR